MNMALPDTERYPRRPFEDFDRRVILPYVARMQAVGENVQGHIDFEESRRNQILQAQAMVMQLGARITVSWIGEAGVEGSLDGTPMMIEDLDSQGGGPEQDEVLGREGYGPGNV